MLTVAVLGEVEARRDGVRLSVPTGKTTELLVRLALAPGFTVRTEVLLEDLWSPGAGRNTLQSKVSQLRAALGGGGAVVAGRDAYRLVIGPDGVDALQVVALAAQATAARVAHDAPTALDSASQGLRMFRGGVLVDDRAWAAPHRVQLEEIRLGLLESVMAARVDLGSGGDVVGELEVLVARHPLREHLWSSLMTALYRGGRQADALAAYVRVRTLLRDELGVDPGPGLRALEQQLLRHSEGLGRVEVVNEVVVPGNLPPTPRAMVGRDGELADLRDLVRSCRCVTVVGSAGVGKTRLLLELARGLRPPGGAWLVRLEAVDTSVALEQVVADTLHVAGAAELRARLSGTETVLLLDNCEHVVENVAVLVGSLLDDVPGLSVVATSQVPVSNEEEVLLHLEPLSSADSVTLFWARAHEARRRLNVDDDATTQVEVVCRALDGLPLAIELAAARVRSLSVGDIARRLDDRFALLRDPDGGRPGRRRALEGAIGWSYDLLFPDDQRGLWALSCFAGSASLEALQHVLVALEVPAGAVVDTVTRLVDRSLVMVDPADGGLVRYRMLDSVRIFATDRLLESGLHGVAHAAHAGWYGLLAAWCAEHVRGGDQPACVRTARVERTNVDAALAWSVEEDPALGVAIATGLGWTWVVLGDGASAATRIRRTLSPTVPVRQRAQALLLAGWLEASTGDVGAAQADLEEAAGLALELGAEALGADVARHQAFVALQQGLPAVASERAATSLETSRRLGLVWESAAGLVLAAYGALFAGDTVAATRHGAEARQVMAALGDSWGLVHVTAMLGGIAQAEHRFEDAAEALAAAARESQALGFVGQAALHLASLARVQQRAGRLDDAALTAQHALVAAAAAGDARMAATVRLTLARMLRCTGEGAAAVPLLLENLSWYAGAGGGDGALLTRCVLAAENRDSAGLKAVLALARSDGDHQVELLTLDGLARARAADGAHDRARGLLVEADRLAPGLAHLLDDTDRPDRDAALVILDHAPSARRQRPLAQ